MTKQLHRVAAVAAAAAGLALAVAAPASAHWLDYDSVVSNKIDYQDNTQYDDARNWAVDRWELSGVVDIQPDTGWTTNDVEFYDLNRPAESWAGLYDNESGDDDIIFNTAYMAGYSTAQRRHVALHELGHALGLGHSYTGQVMQPTVGTIQYIQEHDQYSYDERWG